LHPLGRHHLTGPVTLPDLLLMRSLAGESPHPEVSRRDRPAGSLGRPFHRHLAGLQQCCACGAPGYGEDGGGGQCGEYEQCHSGFPSTGMTDPRLSRSAVMCFTGPVVSLLPINTAPHDGTLIRFWCRSEGEPVIGYWSRSSAGWRTFSAPSAPPERQAVPKTLAIAHPHADARPDGLALRETEHRHSRIPRTSYGTQRTRSYTPLKCPLMAGFAALTRSRLRYPG
jgi:hypothetical protein